MSDDNLQNDETRQLLSNDAYDRLKFLAQIALPGLGALYFAVAQIWGLPKAEEVVGTITAVDVFLGLFLGSQTKAYNESDARFDGDLVVLPGNDGPELSHFAFNEGPETLAGKSEVVLKVTPSE